MARGRHPKSSAPLREDLYSTPFRFLRTHLYARRNRYALLSVLWIGCLYLDDFYDKFLSLVDRWALWVDPNPVPSLSVQDRSGCVRSANAQRGAANATKTKGGAGSSHDRTPGAKIGAGCLCDRECATAGQFRLGSILRSDGPSSSHLHALGRVLLGQAVFLAWCRQLMEICLCAARLFVFPLGGCRPGQLSLQRRHPLFETANQLS